MVNKVVSFSHKASNARMLPFGCGCSVIVLINSSVQLPFEMVSFMVYVPSEAKICTGSGMLEELSAPLPGSPKSQDQLVISLPGIKVERS